MIVINEVFDEEHEILKKYFIIWKTKTLQKKKEQNEKEENGNEPLEKLDQLIKRIKKYQKEEKEINAKAEFTTSNEIKMNQNVIKHRYDAQKCIIKKLTDKLQQKNQVIEELKMGIINKSALQAMENAKYEIREIFSNCSSKVLCKIPPPEDISEKIMIKSQRAPKCLQKMQERAMERAKNREIIAERKRFIEEQRKKALEEALEKKRVQDEEEKQRSLEAIKERRRKELELEKIRRENRIIFIEKLNKAINFENRKLLEKGLRSFHINMLKNRKKYWCSIHFYENSIKAKVIKRWQDFIEDKYRDKYELADKKAKSIILKKYFHTWKIVRLEAIRNWQVAEDYYDFYLQKNAFVYWFRYTCRQIVINDKKTKLADKHYEKKLIFQCFYQWRSLPAVIQLEKTKEEKKRKWREKVWDILPDYKPPDDIFDSFYLKN